jgi:hypothetical protein
MDMSLFSQGSLCGELKSLQIVSKLGADAIQSPTMALQDRLFYPSPPSSQIPEFKASTLIFPSISIGNVPQLAIDLLITTLKIPLVGYLPSPYLVPCAGTREDPTDTGTGGISCPLEGVCVP